MTTKISKGVTLSCITVSDLEKAKYFFTELLGLQVKEFQKEYNWMEIGGEAGGLIGVGQSSKEGEGCGMVAGSNAIISIDVHNLEEAIARLKSHHVKFIGEIMEVPHQIKMILLEDFDGNRFFLCESIR